MKPLEIRKAREAARTKGFTQVEHRHHEILFLVVDGKKTAWRVQFSRGGGEMCQREIRGSARDCGISGDEMFRILSCDLDAQSTLALYRSKMSSAAAPPV